MMKVTYLGHSGFLLEMENIYCLFDHYKGEFPEWNELSDEKLVKSLLMLSDKERELIYLHVFEERSFKKIGEMTGMTAERCKDAYFYAIRKIRKRLGDKKDEL